MCACTLNLNLKRRIVYPILALAAIAALSTGARADDATPVVNVNTATVEQLAYLPGVGSVIAQRIADARTDVGPYTTVEQLSERVKGIGERKLETMRPYVVLTGETTASEKIRVVKSAAAPKDGGRSSTR